MPASEFLQAIFDDARSLVEADLDQLIALMSDADVSNRDWATVLLGLDEIDSPRIRDALLAAARDESEIVRAEAVCGLAKREPGLALPFVQEALRADGVAIPMLEATELCAHPSLIAGLRIWAKPSDDSYADKVAADALAACEAAAEAQA